MNTTKHIEQTATPSMKTFGYSIDIIDRIEITDTHYIVYHTISTGSFYTKHPITCTITHEWDDDDGYLDTPEMSITFHNA